MRNLARILLIALLCGLLLVLAPRAEAVASKVQSAVNRAQATGTTITCTLPGTITPGNYLVVAGTMISLTRTVVSKADTNGETWTQDYYADVNTYDKAFLFSALVVNGGASTTFTLTISANSGGAEAECMEITGQSVFTKTDLQQGDSTAATSVTTATFAPTGSKSVVIQWGRTASSRNVTFTNGTEQHDGTTVAFHEALQFEVSAGTYVSSCSWTTNSNSNVILAVAYTTSSALRRKASIP